MAQTQVRSTKPSPLTDDREQRVRERAYHLWEADGKPHGRDVEYWDRARELLGTEERAGNSKLSRPPTTLDQPRATASKAAEIPASPGGLADRPPGPGDAETAPTPRRRARAKPRKPA